MALILTEEQEMLRDAARGYLSEHAPISQLRRLRDDDNPDGFDRATWAGMAEMGWTGVLVPEEAGGVGLGFVEAGLIAEEMGRTLTASPFLSSSVMGAVALREFGSAAQQGDWLGRLAEGRAITALAVDEGRRHDPSSVAVTAERSGNGFRLNGAKTFVVEAHVADALIVSARTSGETDDEAGITLFLVPADATGLTAERTMMVDSRNAGRVMLEDVEVTADAVLGEVDQGFAALKRILAAGRATLAAEMSGSAQESLGRSLDYIKERKQFGQIVAGFQALQHRAADLYTEIEMGRSIVLKALQALDAADPDAELLVTAAKAKLGRVAQQAAREAIQFHGGVGMTDAVDIGFFLKRVRVAEAWLGDANYHAEQFARMKGY